MRLRDIQQVLTDTIDELQIEARDVGSKNMELHGSRQTVEAIEALKPTGIFQEEVEKLLSVSVIVNNVSDIIVVPAPTYQSFAHTLSIIRNRASVFLGVLNEFIGDQDQYSIGVQLPPRLDLEETANIIRDLDTLLKQTLVNPATDGTITLQGFDRGSEWLEIGLGSKAALAFFAMMVQFYFRVQEKRVEIDEKREQVRALRLENDQTEMINESLAQQLKAYQDQEQNKLLGDDNDRNGRIKFGLNSLKELMDKGLRILPSLSAPEEIKPSFSPSEIEQVRQISSRQEEEKEEKQADQDSEE